MQDYDKTFIFFTVIPLSLVTLNIFALNKAYVYKICAMNVFERNLLFDNSRLNEQFGNYNVLKLERFKRLERFEAIRQLRSAVTSQPFDL